MNIFYVDHDPVVAAQSLVDKHVVKMILETAQLLSTAHRVLDGNVILSKTKTGRNAKYWVLPDERQTLMYSATHINHPSAVWCRASVENYLWLVEHFFALCAEYTYRYEREHTCFKMGYYLQSPPKNLKDYDWTPMPSCMADEYKVGDDPIINYRNYYKVGKSRMHKWKNRKPPEWINE
jgi:hypothetical protein